MNNIKETEPLPFIPALSVKEKTKQLSSGTRFITNTVDRTDKYKPKPTTKFIMMEVLCDSKGWCVYIGNEYATIQEARAQ